MPDDVTRWLDRWNEGDSEAFDQLIPLIGDELRQIAAKCLAQEGPSHTLEPTVLVDEVYLRLAGRRRVDWLDKKQFFGFVGALMRRILVEHARNRQRVEDGLSTVRLSPEGRRLPNRDMDPNPLVLDSALVSLAGVDPRQSRIVEMRYFAGLSFEEIAEIEEIPKDRVEREWRTAKLWLYRELEGDDLLEHRLGEPEPGP